MKTEKIFAKQWTRRLPLLNIDATLYVHNKTGAEVIHLKNDDKNKCFAIGFQTIPSDSTGVAHILEHSVLAGSKNYPVKDPFALLLKSSLKTFLNAFTYPDKTVYPVASQNDEDLKNLMGVYLDAVFFPRLTADTFAQEGWHLEANKEKKQLSYKGVVYNEMKGSYSNVDNLVEDHIFNNLYPDTCYSVDSGGNPEVIPNLTHENLKAFHAAQYHPSNANIYFYGDLDIDMYLEFLDTYLSQFEGKEALNRVQVQKRFSEPVVISKTIPATAEKAENGGISLMTWMLGDESNLACTPKDRFAWSILSYLLLESDASPYKKALLDSNLGESIIGGGFEADLMQPAMYFGLRNVKPQDFEKVEALIISELKKVVENGIEKRLLESVMSKVEFEFREMADGGASKGVSLFTTMLQSWLYGRDPLEPLNIGRELVQIKNEIETESTYFTDLISNGLLNNSHKVILRLSPDVKFQEKALAKETETLAKLAEKMSAEDFAVVVENTAKFEAYQKAEDSPESLQTLPKLEVSKIQQEITPIPSEEKRSRGVNCLLHPITSNGIVYVDFVFDIAHLSPEQCSKVVMLGEYLFRLDTKNTKAEELALLLDLYAGGYGTDSFIKTKIKTKQLEQKFVVSVKCLAANVEKVATLVKEILTTLDFSDDKKVMQILLEQKAESESALVYSGHIYALNYSRAAINKAYAVLQSMEGVAFIQNLKKWSIDYAEKGKVFATEMLDIYKSVFKQSELLVNVTGDESLLSSALAAIDSVVKALPEDAVSDAKQIALTSIARSTALIIPAQVSYQGYSLDFNAFDKVSRGALLVISKYITLEIFWKKIRQLGGAYGCGIVFDFPNEIVSMYSYRDPVIKRTFDTFAATGELVLESVQNLSQRDVDDCIIGAIAVLDSPMTVEEKGYTALNFYVGNIDNEYRQAIRNQVLSTTKDDFIAFAKSFNEINKKKAGMATLTGSELLETDKSKEIFDTVITI